MEYNIKGVQERQLRLLETVTRICDENNMIYYAAYGTVLGAIRHKGFIPWDGDVDIYIPENELDTFISVMEKNLPDEYWIDFRDKHAKMRDFPRIGYKGFDTNLLHVDVFRLAGAPDDINKQKRLRKITGTIHHIMNVKQKGAINYILSGHKVFKALGVSLLTAFIPLRVFAILIDYYSRKYPFESANYVGNSTSGSIGSIFPKDYLGKGIMVEFEGLKIRIPEQYEAYLNNMYKNYREFPPIEERERALNYVFREVVNPQNGLKTLVYK